MVRKRNQRGDNMKVFEKWDSDKVKINDLSLSQVVSFSGGLVPHTHGRHVKNRLAKMKVNVIERFINKLMRGGTGKKVGGRFIRTHGRLQGKKLKLIAAVDKAFDIIYEQTKQNPLQVFIKALENTAPREDVTRVKVGGVSYQISVDVSGLRRLDIALKNLALASLIRSFNKQTTISQAIAEELITASQNDIQNSFAVKKKDEIERIAKSAR